MKLIPLISCGLGGASFLFAAITAVTGPNIRVERNVLVQQRIENIARSAAEVGDAGGCCQKKQHGSAAKQSGSEAVKKDGCGSGSHEKCR